jgi:hypothetical protein
MLLLRVARKLFCYSPSVNELACDHNSYYNCPNPQWRTFKCHSYLSLVIYDVIHQISTIAKRHYYRSRSSKNDKTYLELQVVGSTPPSSLLSVVQIRYCFEFIVRYILRQIQEQIVSERLLIMKVTQPRSLHPCPSP